MIQLNFLEADDIITEDTWYRPLSLIQPGDFLYDNSMFGGRPSNHPKWCLVGIDAPGYVGKTVKYFNNSKELYWEEFIQGDIPSTHIHNCYFTRYLKFSRGKYTGYYKEHIKERDEKYFHWYDSEVRKYVNDINFNNMFLVQQLLKEDKKYNKDIWEVLHV